MELFKLVGEIVIKNQEALHALEATKDTAKQTSETIKQSNEKTKSSNTSTGSSWTNLKSKVAEYKAQGMSTSKAWRQASQDMKSSTEDAGNGMVSAFKKIGAAVATYLTVDAIKNFGLSCIQAAADAQAMESQFSQVFGELEGSAGESLSKIADNAGITENRMKGSFTKIAAFAKTTGMDTESALALSERAMIAVADSAAFYDRSLEETTESLQSFLKGNFENDAALGLSCTEVTRNTAANELYGKSFKDLSESQKQLTLLKMVEDANAASGALDQAARESDTWTNVTGNLKQAWTDFQAVLGSNILPSAVGVVKKMVGVVEDWTAKLPALVEWCKEHKTELTAILIVVGSVAAAIAIYASGLTVASVATTVMTAASSAFAAVIGFLKSPIALVVVAIGALAAAFIVAYNRSEEFRNFINKLKDGIVDGFNAMKEAAVVVKDRLVAAWDEITAKCEPLIATLKEKLAGSIEWLNEKIAAAREAFTFLAEKAGILWDKLEPLATTIRDNLMSALQNLEGPIQTIKESFAAVWEVIQTKLLPIFEKLSPVIDFLKYCLIGIAGTIGGALLSAIGLAIGLFNGIVLAISGFAEAIAGVVQIVAGVIQAIVGVFTGDGDMILEAADNIGEGIISVFGGLWDAVSGFVSGFVDGVIGFFESLWDTLVGHSIVPDTIDGIVDCFAGLWDSVSGLVSDFVDGVTGFFTDLKDKSVKNFNELKDKGIEKFNNLKDKVSTAATNTKDKAVSAWNNLKDKTTSVYNTAKDKAVSAFNTLKDKVSETATSTKEKATSAWSNLKDKTDSLFNEAKEKASTAFSSLKSKVTDYSSATGTQVANKFESMKSTLSLVVNDAKNKAATAFSAMKSSVIEHSTALATQTGNKFNSMKDMINAAASNAKTLAVSAFNTMKSTISTAVSGAYNSVVSSFDSIKSKISGVMESAKSIVSNAISAIKNAFNFSVQFNVRLPHISVYGGVAPYGIGGKGSLPSFSVSWYKKAYDEAMVLNNPAIFGYSAASGKLLGGGEGNGNEVVAGEDHLLNLIGQVVEGKTAEQNDKIIEILIAILNAITGGNEEMLRALLSGQKFVVGEREFARLVRTYA